jgi:transposase-like protein
MRANSRRPRLPVNSASPAIVSTSGRKSWPYMAAFPGSWHQAEPAAELARLTRELARVTEERDILKTAAKYFAQEST